MKPGTLRYRLSMVRWGYHCHGLRFAWRVFRDYGKAA